MRCAGHWPCSKPADALFELKDSNGASKLAPSGGSVGHTDAVVQSPWLILVPIPAVGWWLLGFPPGWGWIVLPMVPGQPVTLGMLLVLATVVLGAYAGLAWLRTNF